MSDTEQPTNTPEVAADTAASDTVKTASKKEKGAELSPPTVDTVDNEIPEAPRPDLRPGAMGPDRVRLVLALGLPGTHDFDGEVENLLREKTSYDGVVDAKVWEELAVLLV